MAPPPPPPQPQIIVVQDPTIVTPIPAPVAPAPVVPTPVVPVPTPEPEPAYDDGANPFISAEIAGIWNPNDQWSVQLALARNAQVSSDSGDDFREVFSTRASVSRRFERSVLTLTGAYQIENPLREQTNGQSSLDRQYLTADLSYSFPIWKDRAWATTFVRYREDQSGNSQDSWDGYQTGLAVGISF